MLSLLKGLFRARTSVSKCTLFGELYMSQI